jgi:hypothetical protein
MCPRCGNAYGTEEAQVIPAIAALGGNGVAIPERYLIFCRGCDVPFYTPTKSAEEFTRVDGGWECSECGEQAREHAEAKMPHEGSFVRLCDGRLAKL